MSLDLFLLLLQTSRDVGSSLPHTRLSFLPLLLTSTGEVIVR